MSTWDKGNFDFHMVARRGVHFLAGRRRLNDLPANIFTAILLVLAINCHAGDDKPSTVQDLRYGVALYHYFQKDYQAAINELLIAEERGGIQGHADSGQLMRGGLNLAMGMEKQAREIFERLLDDSKPESIRNTAWFYLGKLRYQRDDWDGARESFARIHGVLSPDLDQELQALEINLALRQQNFQSAEQTLAKQQHVTPWSPYAWFNLAMAWLEAGDAVRAVHYLDTLVRLPVKLEEHLALRDKALTAAGYSLMQQGDYRGALQRFRKVRMASPLGSRALLGYGWAAAEIKDYKTALTPWQTLARDARYSPESQQVFLAIPWLYEKLDAKHQALEHYLAAEARYGRQLGDIDNLRKRLNREVLLAAFDATRSENETSHVGSDLARISSLLTQQRFQNRASELRDLMGMAEQLQAWTVKLDMYRYLLQERGVARAQKLKRIDEQQFPSRIEQLSIRQTELSRQLAQVENTHNVIALADPDVSELWAITEKAQAAISELREKGHDTTDYQAVLQRYRGILLWQANEQFPVRLWQARKKQKQLANALTIAVENETRLHGVITTVPEIAPYLVRLKQLEQRLDVQQLALNQRLDDSESELRGLVLAELDRQQQHLRQYQARARLSLARLYDSAANAPAKQDPAL